MRTAIVLAAVAALPGFQDGGALLRLAHRCGSQVPWKYDVKEALDAAAKERKLVLAVIRTPYVGEPSDPRAATRPEDPGEAVELLVMAAVFTDPDVAALAASRFVPLRTAVVLRTQHEAAKSRKLPADPLAPLGLSCDRVKATSLAVCTPDGTCLRVLDRIGTFDPDLVLRFLRECLAAGRGWSRPSAKGPWELLAQGELDAAERGFAEADRSYGSSRAAALRGDHEKALELAGKVTGARHGDALVQAGVSNLRLGRLPEAEAALRRALGSRIDRRPEALYHLGVVLDRIGKAGEAAKAWKELTEADPDSPWAWKAACRLEPKGWKVPHLRECEVPAPPGTKAAETTERGAKGARLSVAVEQGIDYLLATQRSDGGWRTLDSYEWPGVKPNGAAVTAIAAEALLRWDGEVSGARQGLARKAGLRALGYLENFLSKAPPQAQHVYDDCYALAFLTERLRRTGAASDKALAQKFADRLASYQLPDGRWSYMSTRPHSFDTANAILRLVKARESGLDVDAEKIRKAGAALKKMRRPDGSWAYWADCSWPSKERPADGSWMWTIHASAARAALCENALAASGTAGREQLKAGIELFLKYRAELESPRKNYFGHFDTRGHGAYFFFFAYRHAAEALRDLGREAPAGALDAVRNELLAVGELDGSWIDQYENGKPYGTGMALVALSLAEKKK